MKILVGAVIKLIKIIKPLQSMHLTDLTEHESQHYFRLLKQALMFSV